MLIKRKSQFDTLVEIALYLNVLYLAVPFLRVLPNTIRLGFKLLPIVCCCFAVVCLNSQKKYVEFVFVILTGCVIGLSMANSLYGLEGTSFGNELSAYFIFYFMLMLGLLLDTTKNIDCNKLINLFLSLIQFTCFTTIFGNFIFPEASRIIVRGDVSEAVLKKYYMYNIGSFGFAYMLVLLIPCVCFLIRKGEKKRIFDLVLYCTALMSMKYTTALIIGALGMSLLIIKNQRGLCFATAFCSIIVLFGNGVIVGMLGIISRFTSLMSNNLIDERIQELRTLLTVGYVSGDTGARLYYNQLSLNCFKAHPFFGNLSPHSTGEIGAHSFLLDFMGAGGIFGMIFLLILIFVFIRSCKKGDSVLGLYQDLVMVQIIILALVNMVKNAEVGFSLFVVPFLLCKYSVDNVEISNVA